MEETVLTAGYVDVDCGLRDSDVPDVTGILESPSCCSVDCEDDDCLTSEGGGCNEVVLSTVNAVYNATCRLQVNTVTNNCQQS